MPGLRESRLGFRGVGVSGCRGVGVSGLGFRKRVA